MTTPSGDGNRVGDATIRVRGDTSDADSAIRSFARTTQNALQGIGRGGLSLAAPIASIGAAAGGAIPVVAGVAASLANIAPAAAGAATGFLAIRAATATLQLAMVGVQEAVSAAFATGEGSAEAFQESIEGLAPSARAFAVTVRDLRGDFVGFQQSIQQEFFTELDDVLRNTAQSVLPVLQENLLTTSRQLSFMGAQAANAAADMAENGTLGTALEGANQGLSNLSALPAQIVQGFLQIAAAGAPAFDSLTRGVGGVADSISQRLSAAFESGALQDAVGDALDILSQLGPIASDALGLVQNLFAAASVQGDSLFVVLGTVFDVLNQFTGTEAFQTAISGLIDTVGTLATTAAPLLISALQIIAPVLTNLAGPVQVLIQNLGAGLTPIIQALGPVLNAASMSLGILVESIAPILPIIGQLIAQLGPILVPMLQQIGTNVQLLAPFFIELVEILSGALQPILAILPSLIQPILDALTQLLTAVLPILNALFVELSPVIDELSASFIELLVALAPVLADLILLATDILVALTPVLIPLIGLIARLSTVMSGQLASTISNIVVPALNAVAALLRGDFSGALSFARQLVGNFISTLVSRFTDVPRLIFGALSGLAGRLTERMEEAMRDFIQSARSGISDLLGWIRDIPSRVRNTLGDLGSVFFSAGRALIQGLVDGVLSMVDRIRDAVGSIMDVADGLLPGSPAREGPFSGSGYTRIRGQHLSQDFAQGIEDEASAPEDATRALVMRTAASLTTDLDVGALPLGIVTRGPAGPPSGPVTVALTLVNQGVLGSRTEVLDWLTLALDDLRRQRRLPQGVTA